MAGKAIKLTVVSGPQAGYSFELVGMTMIGRDPGCDVVINDSSVSSRHARILIEPEAKVSDLNSANHTFLNNVRVMDAPLRSGDVIVFGSIATRFEVHDPEAEAAAKKSRTRKLILASVIFLLIIVLGAMYVSMQRQESIMLRETPLSATGLSNSVNMRGLLNSKFPTHDEFVPQTENVVINRIVTPWLLMPNVPTNRGEMEISRVFPPDPPDIQYRLNRPWPERPPRLGSRRIVRGPTLRQSFVLGTYRSVEWTYRNDDLADTVPLNFSLLIQMWDGLPRDADVSWVGLDRPALEKGEPTTRPVIPRRHGVLVADRFWDERTETVQSAHIGLGDRRMFFRFEKVGEILYMVTFNYPAHQRPRLEELAEELIKAQELPGRDRSETDEQLREMAVLLEREADALVPNLSGWNFDDFERFDRKSDLLRAFTRYMKALEFRQVTGDWINSSEYQQLLAKTLMIYDYVENDRSVFRRLFWQIEDGISAHRMRRAELREVKQQLETLHRITYEGTDLQVVLTLADGSKQTVRLLPDDWFMYTHLRNIAVRQLEGR